MSRTVRSPRSAVGIAAGGAFAALLALRHTQQGWGATPEYRPGQYLGIGVLLNGRWTWRSYSLTSAPTTGRGEYSVTVKALPEGLLSNHIVGTVEPGMIVRLQAPAGDFHLPSPTPERSTTSGIIRALFRSRSRLPSFSGSRRRPSRAGYSAKTCRRADPLDGTAEIGWRAP